MSSNWKKDASSESVHAMWHDPSTYDPMRMGPPYLPGRDVTPVPQSMVAADNQPELVRVLVAGFRKRAESIIEQVVHQMKTDQMGAESEPMSELGTLLVFLRAASFIHQTHHWQTRGVSFYADHQLFERLYNETLPFIDQVAERAVGAGSVMLVSGVSQAQEVATVVQSLYAESGTPVNPGPEDMVSVSLGAVLCVLSALRIAFESLDGQGRMSDGTDDLLQSVANAHESFAYLLKQRSAVKVSHVRNWKAV